MLEKQNAALGQCCLVELPVMLAMFRDLSCPVQWPPARVAIDHFNVPSATEELHF